jgi:hypothetical protein
MLRKLALALLVVTFYAATALAADVSGKWKGTVETPRGSQELSFEFHVDGAKLTGSVTSPRGTSEISEGKIEGDTITFKQSVSFNGNDFTIDYSGKVDGDTIKFTRTMGDRPPTEFTAARFKEGQ